MRENGGDVRLHALKLKLWLKNNLVSKFFLLRN